MFKTRVAVLCVFAATGSLCGQQAHPRDGEIHDADTKAWWHTTEELSGDDMEGRDTGSAAYLRAAKYVAKRFEAAGLKPAGEKGDYFQNVPMHEVEVPATRSRAKVWVTDTSTNKNVQELWFLKHYTVAVTDDLPVNTTVRAPLVFRGYCGKGVMKDVAGKIVICFGTQRAGLPSAAERGANARGAGAVGIANVDDPYFTIEPPRWPYAYARTVTLKDGRAKAFNGGPFLQLRISAGVFGTIAGRDVTGSC